METEINSNLSYNLFPVTNGKEEIILDHTGLRIKVDGEFLYAMHEGETNLSKCMAELVTNNGGDILEIGFGIGASSNEIQKNNDVTTHTIIELNKKVYDEALIWAENKKNVEIILGDWVDILPNINKKFDGILHDTWYDNNMVLFPDMCKNISNINTILVFYYYPHYTLEEYNDQNKKMFNVKEYQFSINEYERLPESYSYYDELYKNRIYTDLRYTVFDGEKFVKPNFTL
jgi:spermidine synthase